MNEGKSQPWYQLYSAAIIELDRKQLMERVDATEAAIHGRLLDLQYDSDHHEERQMMGDAQRALEFLRRQAALRCPENSPTKDDSARK